MENSRENSYIHIGGDISIPEKEIVGIFDLERVSVVRGVNEMLSTAEKTGKTRYTSFDMPKSFVISEDKVYVSNIATGTIKRRVNRGERD